MSKSVPTCRTVTVVTFRGDRSRGFGATFQKALDDERKGIGRGPTPLDCLLFAGHTGVSIDGGATIHGFNPQNPGIPIWQLLDDLKNGDAFKGVVRVDTALFSAANARGLKLLSFNLVLPDPRFQTFKLALDSELYMSQYLYGFPNGNGDCNCTTWLERMGLPLLTGRMDEFVALPGFSLYPSRRFGECI
jgi:hypothetical protein